ncbi:MAG: hypothetical protein ACYST6_04980 [Planctomycetota bacterium]
MCKTRFSKKDLLVVIGTIAFVLANLGAVGANGRRRAKEAVCLSNQLKWGIIWKSYTDDHDGYFPPSSADEWGEPTMGAWPWVIREYYPRLDPRIFLCPAATKPADAGGTDPYAAWVLGSEGRRIIGSYACNFWVANDEDEKFWRTPYVADAAKAPLLLDGKWKDVELEPSDEPCTYDGAPGGGTSCICINRHSGGVNGIFLDFSARKIGLTEFGILKWHREWPEGNDHLPH